MDRDKLETMTDDQTPANDAEPPKNAAEADTAPETIDPEAMIELRSDIFRVQPRRRRAFSESATRLAGSPGRLASLRIFISCRVTLRAASITSKTE